MDLDIGTLRGILTVLIFGAFIGMWIWAWSSRRRKDFNEAAQLPLAEDPPVNNKESGAES